MNYQGNRQMDIKQIRKEKENLEDMLRDLVAEFEKLTEIRVGEIYIRRTQTIGIESEIYHVDTICEV